MEGLTTRTDSLDEEVTRAFDFVKRVNDSITSSPRIRSLLEELRLPGNKHQKKLFELRQALLEGTRVNLSGIAIRQYKEAMRVLEEKGNGYMKIKEVYELSCIFYKVLAGS